MLESLGNHSHFYMKKILAIFLILMLSLFLLPQRSNAAVAGWDKAASIVPRNNTDFESNEFKESMRNLKSINANAVSLIIPIYTSSCNSSDIQRGGDTPTDQSLGVAIDHIKSLGMLVILKPHLEAWDKWGGHCAWRAYIDPADKNTFFGNYEEMLKGLAALRPGMVDEIVIGCELIKLPTNPGNTSHWDT